VEGKQTGSGPRNELIEPIWEYHHDVGKSITGGNVYRGKQVPALAGKYLYADYVTGKLWALDYDANKQRVVGNHPLTRPDNMPIITFGEDEAGEVYFGTDHGKVYRFEKSGK
jgi:outer membrane protein assembly factor BamB